MLRINNKKNKTGFTLIELLVVIAIIALLMSILMPSLNRARQAAKGIACQGIMKQWTYATVMYSSSNDDAIPYFGDGRANDVNTKFWFEHLGPFLSTKSERTQDTKLSSSKMFENKFRRCPSGHKRRNSGTMGEYDCYIGANFGLGNNASLPLSAPFYYSYMGGGSSPLKLMNIRQPSQVMGFLDVVHQMVYSPAETGGSTSYSYQFDTDTDGDGRVDSAGSVLAYGGVPTPYNYARPKVHHGGCNVGLLDGHVEWVSYTKLWEVDDYDNVVHPFWHIKRR